MPRQNSKTAVASSKRWLQKGKLSEAASSFHSKITQTSTTSSTSIATQTAKTEKYVSVPHDICTPEELLSFAEEIPTLLAINLPSHIGVDVTETTLSETITGQLGNILAKYEHELQEATTQKLQVMDSQLCLTTSNFLVAAFEYQVCNTCTSSGNLRATRTREVKTGITQFELTCQKCKSQSFHTTDSRTIDSKFRPKSWLPNFILLFFLNGEYYKDYEHVLGTLGLDHLSQSQ